MPLTGYLLLNRLLWLGAGVAVLAWAVLGFDPQPRSQKSGRDSGEPEAGEEETLIELTVDERPAAVIVDPYHNFIERNLDDNVKRL